jgi:hypothetical protein
MGQRRHYPIRLVPIEFLLQQAEYSSRHSQRVAGQRWGQVGRNEGCEFHRLAFVGRLSRNAPAVVEDPSHEKRELRPQVHGLFRRQAIAQDVQHRSQRPVSGPMITAGGYTTKTAVSAIEAKLADAVAFGRMFIANPDLPQRVRAGVPLCFADRRRSHTSRPLQVRVFQRNLRTDRLASTSSEAGRPLDEINHVGCGMYGKRMMGKARPRRDVTGHFAREFELLIRCRSEQRNQQIL